MSLVPGQRVEGFEIRELLSSALHGNVYRAADGDGGFVVLKEIFYTGKQEEMEERGNLLFDALEFLEGADQYNLATIHDFFSGHHRAFVVMEDVKGRTLRALRNERALTGHEIITIMFRICQALEYLQEGEQKYFFSALTPSHIIIDDKGEPHLVNFGLSRFFKPIKPKSAVRRLSGELREDLEAAARVMFFMAMGKEGDIDAIQSCTRLIPPEFRQVLARFLPGEKPYSTISELKLRFQELLTRTTPAQIPKDETVLWESEIIEEHQKERGSKVLELLQKMKQEKEDLACIDEGKVGGPPQSVERAAGERAAKALLEEKPEEEEPEEEAPEKEKPEEAQAPPARAAAEAEPTSEEEEEEEDEFDTDAPPRVPLISADGIKPKAARRGRLWKILVGVLAPLVVICGILYSLYPTAFQRGGRALVLSQESDKIFVHDTKSTALRTTVKLDAAPSDIAYIPNGNILVIALAQDRKIIFVRPDTFKVVSSVQLKTRPERVAADPLGRMVFALSGADNMLTVIPLKSDGKIAEVPIPGEPRSMVYLIERQLVYVASRKTNYLQVVDLKTLALKPAVRSLREDPVALALSPAGTEIWSAQWKTSTLNIVNATNLTVQGAVILKGEHPVALAFSPDGLYAYAALYGANQVTRVTASREDGSEEISVETGKKPYALAHDTFNRLWVACIGEGALSIIDTRSFTHADKVPTGAKPAKILFLP